ncbi:MAG: DUF1295 domain-containing protein, partial [Candidatus Aenigmarchaeota archaeon]|nr:DUF1295 domain-containing protein [Candidatus Aenigmarchaeota archaeon]
IIIQTAVIIIYMTVWFLIAQVIRRNDIADILWGTGFILTAATALILSGNITARGIAAAVLVTLWGARLA